MVVVGVALPYGFPFLHFDPSNLEVDLSLLCCSLM